ncbi:MAG: PD40 domain-containing protein [Candidatus Hydrogenedentes bacterium]|nr:PD40 domain-containing protein [Candidatus Hydrogenedentota bacterium]
MRHNVACERSISNRVSRGGPSFLWTVFVGVAIACLAVRAQDPGPGRILTSSGVAFGGIIGFNPDGSNVINFTSNTFDSGAFTQGGRHKSEHPSVSGTGKIAFASTRTGRWRIFVMNGDASELRQLTDDSNTGERPPIDVDDLFPVISPDGLQVAFISNRSDVRDINGNFYGLKDLFIVNTDGTGLRQVTASQIWQNGASRIASAVWNPDGTLLAFRGVRLVDESGTMIPRDVIGTIRPDGTEEQSLRTLADCAGGTVLDWSPDGSRILYSQGGGVQGCYDTYYLFLGLNGTPDSSISHELLGGVPNNQGSARFSPDGQKLAYTEGSNMLSVIGVDGTGKVSNPVPVAPGSPLWWMPGPPLPAAARIELGPDPVVVWLGHPVQTLVTVYDALDNVIVHAPQRWDGDALVSNEGLVYAREGNSTAQLGAVNGPLPAVWVTVLNYNTPVITVTAPDAEASEAGDTASVTIARRGNLDSEVSVLIGVKGTATNGADFVFVGGLVTLPAGVSDTSVVITPIDDSLHEGEEVLNLTVLPLESGYVVGSPNAALLTIADNDEASTAFSVSSVVPDKGGDTGPVTVSIFGAGFLAGAQAQLVNDTKGSIAAGQTTINEDGTMVEAIFDLSGQPRGLYNVVVTNSDSNSATLSGAFTIEEGRFAEVWADLIGPQSLRTGRSRQYTLLFGNRGNVDAAGALLFVAGLPANAHLTPGPEFLPTAQPEGVTTTAPLFIQVAADPEAGTTAQTILPFATGALRPGTVGTATFQLEVPTAGDYQLELLILSPSNVLGGASGKTTGDITPVAERAGHLRPASAPPKQAEADSAALQEAYNIAVSRWGQDNFTVRFYDLQNGACVGAAEDLGGALTDASGLPNSALDGWTIRTITNNGYGLGHTTTLLTSPDGQRHYLVDNYVTPSIIPMVVTDQGWEIDPVFRLLNTFPNQHPFLILEDIIAAGRPFTGHAWNELSGTGGSSGTCSSPNRRCPRTLRVVASTDPNGKFGSEGAGESHFVTGEDPLRYVIMFENLETATAPAAEVLITDQLDPAVFDMSSFSLGPLGFGETEITPPAGRQEFITQVDLRPTQELLVKIEGVLNPDTGLVLWRFTSLDPATGLPPEEGSVGFLPPNVTPPEGEGRVLFNVRALAGLATGTEIRNRATIVFDANDPITTEEWLNVIDNTEPESQVNALDGVQYENIFPVSWSGVDEAAGISGYSVYVSEDGSPFVPWILNSTDTFGTFIATSDKNYQFFSIARDQAGNVEDAPAEPDATTRTAGIIDADVDASGNVDAVDVQLVINAALGLATEGQTDVNRDGTVNAVDVQRVINAALGLV